MTTLGVSVRGPLAADEVWERYALPSCWASWSPQITRVCADADRLATGVTGRVHGWFGVSVDFVVDDWDDAARRWSWTARRGPLSLRLDHGVAARGSGCETWLRVHGPLPVVLGYLPAARLALHRLVR